MLRADLPLDVRIGTVLAVGAVIVVLLAVAFFVVPDLWRAGREVVENLLAPPKPEPVHDADECGCGNDAPWCPYNPNATEVTPYARSDRSGPCLQRAADRVRPARASLDAAVRLGSAPRVERAAADADVPRVRGLSERVSGLGAYRVIPRTDNGRPSAAKGFKR